MAIIVTFATGIRWSAVLVFALPAAGCDLNTLRAEKLAFRLPKQHDVAVKRKPHENGVVVEHKSGSGWQWAATPAEPRLRYLDVVERITASSRDEATRVQLVELGQVIEETTLEPGGGTSNPSTS
jgi:hypothetical protein